MVKKQTAGGGDYLTIVRQTYENAITTDQAFQEVITAAKNHANLEPNRIMLGDSLCADDVVSIQYPPTGGMLGPFKLGGLDGFPFTGDVGMGAMVSHIPDDGALCIFYAPHIGISRSGKPGEICRIGQSTLNGACGAALKALDNLSKGYVSPGNVSQTDFQFQMLEQILLQSKKPVNDIKDATNAICEAIEIRIRALTEKTFFGQKTAHPCEETNSAKEGAPCKPNPPCKWLFLLGGILINTDGDNDSFLERHRFEIYDLENCQKMNLLALKPEWKPIDYKHFWI